MTTTTTTRQTRPPRQIRSPLTTVLPLPLPLLPLPLLPLLLLALPLRAQYDTQLTALVSQTPIVIEAPFPFVDASRVLPEAYAKRRQTAATAAVPTRLIAWFIPTTALKNELNETPAPSRALQVQVQRDAEPARYAPPDLAAQRAEFIHKTPNAPALTETDAPTLFSIYNLSQLQETPARKILGYADLGPDSFTICIATSIEGKDLDGARPMETSIVCVTTILIKQKLLQLTVACPGLTPAELRNAMRLTREWITLLRAANNERA